MSADHAPPTLSIEVWHETELRTLAWIVCLGFLTVGILLERFHVRYRVGFGVSLLAVAAAATIVVPDPYPLLLGAGISGTLLALVLARRWLVKPNLTSKGTATASQSERSRLGSTASFNQRAFLLLAAIALADSAMAWSQETNAASSEPSAVLPQEEARNADAAGERELIVVVPTSLGANPVRPPADGGELVYVRRDALDRLRQRQKENNGEGDFVFLSAKYEVAVEEGPLPLIDATYRIALMSRKMTSIRIPLSNVTLSGADACRLDGRPYPLRKTDDGFALNLKPDDSGSADSTEKTSDEGALTAAEGERRPVIAPRPETGVSSLRPRLITISLKVFPERNQATGSGAFEIGVPRIADTSIRRRRSSVALPMTVQADSAEVHALRRTRSRYRAARDRSDSPVAGFRSVSFLRAA